LSTNINGIQSKGAKVKERKGKASWLEAKIIFIAFSLHSFCRFYFAPLR
jgi:hypothetical protein